MTLSLSASRLALLIAALTTSACVRPPPEAAPATAAARTSGVTSVTVEPPPAPQPLEGCPRVNPTCTYQALAVEFGRLPELPAWCEGRLEQEGVSVAGAARVDGLARLSGPASWDILQDIQSLSRTTFSTCYEEGLRLNPALAGVMELEFQVEETRSCVSEIVVVDTDLEDEVTRDCVVNALMGYPLPSAGSRMSTRLVFAPGD